MAQATRSMPHQSPARPELLGFRATDSRAFAPANSTVPPAVAELLYGRPRGRYRVPCLRRRSSRSAQNVSAMPATAHSTMSAKSASPATLSRTSKVRGPRRQPELCRPATCTRSSAGDGRRHRADPADHRHWLTRATMSGFLPYILQCGNALVAASAPAWARSVPEPGTLGLMSVGVVALVAASLRKRK